MKNLLNWLKSEESGQGMVEYGLIIVVIALVAVLTLTTVGTNLSAKFTAIATKIGS